MKKSVRFGDVLGKSWEIFYTRFGLFASLGLLFSFLPSVIFEIWNRDKISYIVSGITPSLGNVMKEIQFLAPWSFGMWLFFTLLAVSMIYVLNVKNKKKNIDFASAIKGGWNFYGKALLLGILMFIFLVPLYILAIIPGLIFQVYWVFALYILVVEKSSVMGSFKKSYDIVKDRWWKVLGYLFFLYSIILLINIFSSQALSFLGIAGTFIQIAITSLGSIFSLIFVNSFYLALKK